MILGKMNRGLTVASSLSSLLKRPLDKEEKLDAHVLGWCIEMVRREVSIKHALTILIFLL